ncbi:MAG: hypothetical protein AMXMBFR66_31360 [Pseudomonadota bacterium]|nr:hypothetical protein [Rubrivivax sp.]NLZ43013.1 hypothetical protein [Comamonadaceae bacterium]
MPLEAQESREVSALRIYIVEVVGAAQADGSVVQAKARAVEDERVHEFASLGELADFLSRGVAAAEPLPQGAFERGARASDAGGDHMPAG